MSIADELERYMLGLINAERTALGLDELQLELNLNESAEDHSTWMLNANVFSHTGSGGSSATQRMETAGFDFSGSWSSAENIAVQSARGEAGYFDDVEDLHVALMNSAGHRANILNANLDYIGIGIEIGGFTYDNGFSGQSVMVTQNFARTAGSVDLDNGNSSGPSSNDPTPSNGSSNVSITHVDSSVSYSLRDQNQTLETLTLTGQNNISGTGNGLNNRITGNSGNNVLNGAWGNDTLIGGAGNDTFRDDKGADRMVGGAGNDTYFIDNIGDVIVENANQGNDHVTSSIAFALRSFGQHLETLTLTGSTNISGTGNGQDNRITGNSGNNLLNGAWGHDTLIGGAGNDTFLDDYGADRMVGGAGNDTYKVDNTGDVIVENSSQGTDHVNASVSIELRDHSQHLESLTLTGQGNISGAGNSQKNMITGNSGNNTLNGAWGNDTLIGGAGNDTFTDDSGSDRMVGGTGDDTYNVDNYGDVIVESAGQGDDHVNSSVAFSLRDHSQHLESLTLTGSGNNSGTGNSLHNTIRGNAGNNTLNGAWGNDTLNGGAGNDTFRDDRGNDVMIGGSGADRFIFGSNFGRDIIQDFNTAQFGEIIDLSAVSSIASFSDLTNNHLTQSGGNAVISDGQGNSITLSGVNVNDLLANDFIF